jgi:hypothetical protein
VLAHLLQRFRWMDDGKKCDFCISAICSKGIYSFLMLAYKSIDTECDVCKLMKQHVKDVKRLFNVSDAKDEEI